MNEIYGQEERKKWKRHKAKINGVLSSREVCDPTHAYSVLELVMCIWGYVHWTVALKNVKKLLMQNSSGVI